MTWLSHSSTVGVSAIHTDVLHWQLWCVSVPLFIGWPLNIQESLDQFGETQHRCLLVLCVRIGVDDRGKGVACVRWFIFSTKNYIDLPESHYTSCTFTILKKRLRNQFKLEYIFTKVVSKSWWNFILLIFLESYRGVWWVAKRWCEVEVWTRMLKWFLVDEPNQGLTCPEISWRQT